jgi:Zn-dependent peptidase ImmA (M78 family)/transcriptional regulator with XRE-family HTH domain
MANYRELLGKRIRDARAQLALTQEDLANQVGFPVAQIISQIERGQREVKAWELVKLAQALRVDISDLLATEELMPRPEILWRAPPEGNKKLIEAEFIQNCQQYALLEHLCEINIQQDLPSRDINLASMSFKDAGAFGDEIRAQFKLGARPAASLLNTLEDVYGVKIWYRNLGEEGSAASVVATFGAAVLMNLTEAPWRRNFSFGHEVFHLLTWQSIPMQLVKEDVALKDKVEKLANAFASNLLLPADDIKLAFKRRVKEGKIGYTDIIAVAREFDVSTAALLYRLRGLRLLTGETVESLLEDPAFCALDRATMRHLWWTPPEIPERFVRLAFIAYQKNKLSRARLAQFLNTSLVDLTNTLLEYGLDDREDYKTDVYTATRR